MSKKIKSFGIKENTKARNNIGIKEDKKPIGGGNIIVDFSSKTAFYSCKVKYFTNFYKSHEEFISLRRELFGQALTYFGDNTLDKLASNSKSTHTHPIKEKDKLELIEDILRTLLKKINPNVPTHLIQHKVDDYMEEIWQLGFNQGIRLIGIRNNNIFKVLFIDHQHLIYPNVKFNDKDVMSFNYCPMTT